MDRAEAVGAAHELFIILEAMLADTKIAAAELASALAGIEGPESEAASALAGQVLRALQRLPLDVLELRIRALR